MTINAKKEYSKEKRKANYESNKEKILEKQKQYYKEVKVAKLLMKNFNMTQEDYNKMFEKQQGFCAICNIHQLDLKYSLVVDHCHITGKIRGLLCHQCNLMLGNSRDNTEILLKGINYLNNQNN